MHLFLDDIRFPQQVTWDQNFPTNKQWFIVRNIDDFKKVIDYSLEDIEHIAFDHDLGPEHYEALTLHHDGRTGLDCAKYLVEQCIDRKIHLPKFSCHSFNPVGKEAILSYLENYRRFSQ